MYLVGLDVYYKMIHGPYNIKLSSVVSTGEVSFSVNTNLLYFRLNGSTLVPVLLQVKKY